MRRLSLILIIFLVCLMSNKVFASEFWMTADQPTTLDSATYAATDNWTEPNQWSTAEGTSQKSLAPGVPPLTTTNELKVYTGNWVDIAPTATCTVDSAVGSYNGVNATANANMYIKPGASIGFTRTGTKNGFRVGSLAVGGRAIAGTVTQTGGTVTVSNLYLGYGGSMNGGAGNGTYTISDGSLSITNDPVSGGVHLGGLSVGSGANEAVGNPTLSTIGKFTVIGTAPTISVTALVVGGNVVAGKPGTNNVGTLDFELGGGVSPISCTSVYLGDTNGTANLVVSLTDELVPYQPILLVKQSGASAVNGTFATVSGDRNGGSAVEGDLIDLQTPGGTWYTYTLTYKYNGETGIGLGNDIALVPEPATIALFGLGLLALVRRQHRNRK